MYESSYPPKLGLLSDAMEYEFLFRALREDFSVPEASIRNLLPDSTLADVVVLCLEKRGQVSRS
jgi:hypothetical protein